MLLNYNLSYLLITPFLLLTIVSCNESEAQKVVTAKAARQDSLKQADSLRKTIEKQDHSQSYYDAVAAIISGVRQTGTLSALQDSTVWVNHREFIDKNWSKVEKTRLIPMAKWTQSEMKESVNVKTAFYPFSGPDFLTVNAFFPQVTKIVMLGLEPVGALPRIEKWNMAESKDYSENLKRSLTEIFERSYFITEYMLRDFQRQKVNGTLPVLCFFMKRSGHVIDSLHYIVKEDSGGLKEVAYADNVKAMGVRITCHIGELTKQIYYFKYDVSNQYFNEKAPFYQFVKANIEHSATYIKSASYVLHAKFMSQMKQLILTSSALILQDDTGIPYDEIENNSGWRIKLYGEYSQPIKNFPYLRMQKSIMAAYEKDSVSVPKLPFHLGYHWTTGKDVLMLATKNK